MMRMIMTYNTDIETGAVKDGTLYWTTKDVNPCGACLVGTVTTSYEKLVEAFGKPTYVETTDDEKVDIEWDIDFGVADFENPDETVIATVYNWKDYDGGNEAMSSDSYEWHIGGHGYEAVECVRKALGLDVEETKEKIEPEIHIVGYGCLTPKHIKSNIKRYLSELEDCSKDYENQFDNINRLAYLLQAHTESLHAYENFGRGIENIDAFNFKNPFEGKHPFDYTSEDHEKWAKIKAEIEVA